MKKNEIKYSSKRLKIEAMTLFIIFSSLCASFVIFFSKSSNDDYELLAFLPLLFSLLSVLFFPLYRSLFKSIFITLFILFYYFRSVLLPVLIVISKYQSLATNPNVFMYLDESIMLLCYELIFIFIIVSYFNHNMTKKSATDMNNIYVFRDSNQNIKLVFKLILLALVSITLFIYLQYPQLKYYISFMFDFSRLSTNQANINLNHMINTVPSYYYRLFQILLNILQIIIPLFLLKYINIKYKKRPNMAITLSTIIVLLSFSFSTSEKAYSFFISITLLLMMYLLYPRQMKKVFPVMLLILIISVFTALFFKTNTQEQSNSIVYISIIAQNYFSGPANLAAAIAINDSPTLSLFFNDILKSSIFTSYFFQSSNSIDLIYNAFYYGFNGNKDQIIPLIGQAYFYFGFLLSPIYVLFFIFMGFRLESKLYAKKDMLMKALIIYFLIIVSVTPILYNMNIFIAILTNRIIPVYLILLLSNMKL